MLLTTFKTCFISFLWEAGMRAGYLVPVVSSSCCTLSKSSQRNSWASCWAYPLKAGISLHTEWSIANGDTSAHLPDHITWNRVCSSWQREICFELGSLGWISSIFLLFDAPPLNPEDKLDRLTEDDPFPFSWFSLTCNVEAVTEGCLDEDLVLPLAAVASSSWVWLRSSFKKHSRKISKWLNTCRIEFI